MSLFIQGAVIGFSIAAPVGPIGILCIQKTLKYGKLNGFITGMGAASADAIYGCVAGFGLSVISNFLIGQQFLLRLIGGIFLCYLGMKIMIQKGTSKSLENKGKSLLKSYFSTFLLTITNPITILSFIAVFAGLGLVAQKDSYIDAVLLVSGVFTGSLFWWLILANFADFFKDKIDLKWVNKLSGSIIITFGLVSLISGYLKFNTNF